MEPVSGSGQRVSLEGAQAQVAEGTASHAQTVQQSVALGLDERQVAVWNLLRSEGRGLTVRQIQAHLSWPAGETDPVVEQLLSLGLITRLNTIVPSYAARETPSEGRRPESSLSC